MNENNLEARKVVAMFIRVIPLTMKEDASIQRNCKYIIYIWATIACEKEVWAIVSCLGSRLTPSSVLRDHFWWI